MLGSSIDAEDAAQEALIRAWRGMERFDGRASLRTWLYRIATNVCLDALAERSRRHLPIEERPSGTVHDALSAKPRTHWLEPVSEDRAVPSDADPAEQAVLRQSIRLAFVAALQHLPPRQRAALLLVEVLGWSAAEVAETLQVSVASVNSALQRARATLDARGLQEGHVAESASLDEAQRELLDRYVDAFHRYDVDTLASLLCEDATFCMPPYELWLQGPGAVRDWLAGRGAKCRGSKLVPVAANGQPAFGQYRLGPEGHSAWALVLLEMKGSRISSWTSFLEVELLFPHFGLPLKIEEPVTI
jgi:RNA polymerase sigma-70 factor, ECF subfamily